MGRGGGDDGDDDCGVDDDCGLGRLMMLIGGGDGWMVMLVLMNGVLEVAVMMLVDASYV